MPPPKSKHIKTSDSDSTGSRSRPPPKKALKSSTSIGTGGLNAINVQGSDKLVGKGSNPMVAAGQDPGSYAGQVRASSSRREEFGVSPVDDLQSRAQQPSSSREDTPSTPSKQPAQNHEGASALSDAQASRLYQLVGEVYDNSEEDEQYAPGTPPMDSQRTRPAPTKILLPASTGQSQPSKLRTQQRGQYSLGGEQISADFDVDIELEGESPQPKSSRSRPPLRSTHFGESNTAEEFSRISISDDSTGNTNTGDRASERSIARSQHQVQQISKPQHKRPEQSALPGLDAASSLQSTGGSRHGLRETSRKTTQGGKLSSSAHKVPNPGAPPAKLSTTSDIASPSRRSSSQESDIVVAIPHKQVESRRSQPSRSHARRENTIEGTARAQNSAHSPSTYSVPGTAATNAALEKYGLRETRKKISYAEFTSSEDNQTQAENSKSKKRGARRSKTENVGNIFVDPYSDATSEGDDYDDPKPPVQPAAIKPLRFTLEHFSRVRLLRSQLPKTVKRYEIWSTIRRQFIEEFPDTPVKAESLSGLCSRKPYAPGRTIFERRPFSIVTQLAGFESKYTKEHLDFLDGQRSRGKTYEQMVKPFCKKFPEMKHMNTGTLADAHRIRGRGSKKLGDKSHGGVRSVFTDQEKVQILEVMDLNPGRSLLWLHPAVQQRLSRTEITFNQVKGVYDRIHSKWSSPPFEDHIRDLKAKAEAKFAERVRKDDVIRQDRKPKIDPKKVTLWLAIIHEYEPHRRTRDASADIILGSRIYRQAYPNKRHERETISNMYYNLKASNVTVQQLEKALRDGNVDTLTEVVGGMNDDMEFRNSNVESGAMSDNDGADFDMNNDSEPEYGENDAIEDPDVREERLFWEGIIQDQQVQARCDFLIMSELDYPPQQGWGKKADEVMSDQIFQQWLRGNEMFQNEGHDLVRRRRATLAYNKATPHRLEEVIQADDLVVWHAAMEGGENELMAEQRLFEQRLKAQRLQASLDLEIVKHLGAEYLDDGWERHAFLVYSSPAYIDWLGDKEMPEDVIAFECIAERQAELMNANVTLEELDKIQRSDDLVPGYESLWQDEDLGN